MESLPEPLQQPTQLLASSPASFQAIYRLPAEWFSSREHFVAVFNSVNRQYGDPKISGAIHPFRLRGFCNRKLKYADSTGRYPFVKEIKNNSAEQPESLQKLIQTIGDGLLSPSEARKVGISLPLVIPSKALTVGNYELPTVHDLRFAVQWYRGAADKYGANIDLSKVDYILAGKMLQYGKSAGLVASTLHRCSPNLTMRHPDTATYIQKTVNSAYKHAL